MRAKKVDWILFDTYIAMIRGSEGSNMFRHSFALVDGEKRDITDDGNLSCAFYVSSLLKIFDLIEFQHTMTPGLIADMERSGWKKIDKPQEGAVILWEKKQQKSGEHYHVGFYLGNEEAIHSFDETRVPTISHYTFDGERAIEGVYWHALLGQ